jgi:hypothetical protein
LEKPDLVDFTAGDIDRDNRNPDIHIFRHSGQSVYLHAFLERRQYYVLFFLLIRKHIAFNL